MKQALDGWTRVSMGRNQGRNMDENSPRQSKIRRTGDQSKAR
jgi:hypothetical protein